MTNKELLKLAKTCRQAGITTFKGLGVEFTLGSAPTKRHRVPKESKAPELDAFEKALKAAQVERTAPEAEEPKDLTPSEQEMLFWSSGDGPMPSLNEDTEQ